MREERSGTTAAPNRSTVIRIRLWIDTNDETSARKTCSLPKAWPGAPPIRHEPTCNFASRTGNSEDYWIKQIWHGHVHDQWVNLVSLSWSFAGNDSDERISRQSKNSDQTISNCFSKFFCYRIYQTGEALGTWYTCCCVNVKRFSAGEYKGSNLTTNYTSAFAYLK